MLIDLIKRLPIIQNIVSWITVAISPIIVHNLGKYMALKKAFFLTGLEKVEGDYYEFGIFTGASFVCAMREHKKSIGSFGKINTKFFGFDSFTGFGNVSDSDKHPFYLDSIFSVDKKRVLKNIKKHSYSFEYKIVEGYFEDSIKGKNPAKLLDSTLARIIFIDCDLRDPAKICFDFISSVLQEGTILIMDDFYSYRGNDQLGLSGAFNYFQETNPQFKWRHLFNYGSLGSVFILSQKNQ